MESVGSGEIRFRVHGPDSVAEVVSAGVFAHQLTTLVRALRAADRAANGRHLHDYAIRELHSSTPEALIFERPLPRYVSQLRIGHSPIAAFEDCVDAIIVGDDLRARYYGNCVKQISKFSPVGFAEIVTKDAKFRLDEFLSYRARAISDPEADIMFAGREAPPTARSWFRGVAQGSFDGTIKAVDLRGTLPQLKLLLTAGGAELDCIFHGNDREQIRGALDRRARIYGRALYDGTSGLPQRVEIDKIEVVSVRRDLMRWSGSFEPFEVEPWGNESG